MSKKVRVEGVVHGVGEIYSPGGYARATFTDTRGLDVSAQDNELSFTFNRTFITDNVDTLLSSLVKGQTTNITWNVTVL